jgi:hypothetical protein
MHYDLSDIHTARHSAPALGAKRSVLASAPWLLVVGAALAMSWWSLYSLALAYRVPLALAVGVSTIFDGAALVLGDLARRYATTTDSGLAPRSAMLALVVTSAWLNWRHALMLGLPAPGQMMFSAPSLIAGGVWELMRRWDHREAMRSVGRVPEALPMLGRWAWLLFPRSALSAQRSIISAQLSAVLELHSAERSALCAQRSASAEHVSISVSASSQRSTSAEGSALTSAGQALADAGAQRSAPVGADDRALSTGRSRAGADKRQLIDAALAALGTGPEVTAPALCAWLAQEFPGVTVGASTARARLAQIRSSLD